MAAHDEGHLEEFESLHLEDNDSIDLISMEASFFDRVIGHIEDIIMDAQFQGIQNDFLEKYWREFDNSEENKLIYMDIFKEYTDVIEKYIEDRLLSLLPDFEMAEFVQQIEQHKDDLEGEVFEILFTFTDFCLFKDMFLDYKAVKEGTVQDLSSNIVITSMQNLN